MKKRVLIFVVMVLLLMLTMAVSNVMARSGSGGEGDDCVATLNYKNIGQPYKGTLKGWLDVEANKIMLCTDGTQLTRAKSDCYMEIPCQNPYVFGTFPLPGQPADMKGWCKTALNVYVHPGAPSGDLCDYGYLMIGGYESIDAGKLQYNPDGSFTVDIVIMPLYVAP